MFKVNVHLFGVPGQFETYPAEDLNSYFQQFYNSQTVPWRFLIRQNKNYVRYIYINYELFSGTNRPGSLMGICVELDGYYFNTPRTQILVALREIYDKLIADGEILTALGEKKISFGIKSFQERKDYLNRLLKTVENGFGSRFREDADNLTTNLALVSPEEIAQISESEKKDNAIVHYFLQYGGVNIVPVKEEEFQNAPQTEIVHRSEQEADYWEKKVRVLELQAKEEREKRVNLEKKVLELQNKAAETAVANKPSQKISQPTAGQDDWANISFDDNRRNKPSGFPFKTPFLIVLIIAIVLLIFVFKALSGLFGDSSSSVTTNNSLPNIDTSVHVFNNTAKDTSQTIHRPVRVESVVSNTPHPAVNKSHVANGKSKSEQAQLIADLKAQVNYYIDSEPYNETRDKNFLSAAEKLNCRDVIQDMLDKHRDDSKIFSRMRKETDISTLNTLSYKIAVLLLNGHSDDEVTASLKNATGQRISAVKKNLSSF